MFKSFFYQKAPLCYQSFLQTTRFSLSPLFNLLYCGPGAWGEGDVGLSWILREIKRWGMRPFHLLALQILFNISTPHNFTPQLVRDNAVWYWSDCKNRYLSTDCCAHGNPCCQYCFEPNVKFSTSSQARGGEAPALGPDMLNQCLPASLSAVQCARCLTLFYVQCQTDSVKCSIHKVNYTCPHCNMPPYPLSRVCSVHDKLESITLNR